MKTQEESIKSIENFKKAIVKCPKEKIKNINTDSKRRDKNFCTFIMSYGRADDVKTFKLLMDTKDSVYNQDLYLICSDDDKQLDKYIENFGDKVLIFNKQKMLPYIDRGDNFDRYNVILYARNICFAFAKRLGYQYFVELDDDYDLFSQRIHYDSDRLVMKKILDYDELFRIHLDFLKNTPCKTVTMSQHGDYIGGAGNNNVVRGWQRKVMNSFFCDTENPIIFDGSINEDVNYYTQSGLQGYVNFNLFGFALNQIVTQQSSGGMTENYQEGGTYLKSFYSVMYSPGTVKISSMGQGNKKRMHHRVNSNTCYPKILDERYTKKTYKELNENDNFDEF
jgi:hypothetical protein